MNKIIFEREDIDFGEPTHITFDVEEMTIYEFKTICKRLASAIGFTEQSIEDEFGSETIRPEEMMAQAHIHDMIHNKFIDFDKTGSL